LETLDHTASRKEP